MKSVNRLEDVAWHSSHGFRTFSFLNNIGAHMPFFLVTHRSLVEADSDQEAALKALEKIESGGKLEFEVKFDEAKITRVVVSAKKPPKPTPDEHEGPAVTGAVRSMIEHTDATTSVDQNLPRHRSEEVRLKRPDRRTTTIVSVVLGGLVVMTLLLGTL